MTISNRLLLLVGIAIASLLTLAGINSASGVTLAGSPAALSVIESHLQQQRVFCRRLALDYAFHSPAMDPIASIRCKTPLPS